MPYIFYDTETTGLETEFDQILQFAAILTDDDFNELDHFDVRCQLLPHVIPGPYGLLKTRIPISTLVDKNLPTHYEAIKQIREKLLKWSPAIFIGYNSISYDEELLRNTFFQTLHPAYLTNTGGNARADIMRIAYAAHVYAPGSINVPIGERGQPVFKLDQLAVANGYKHDDAHEALADVRMTIQLAKLIRKNAPEIWESMMGLAKKNDVFEMLTQKPEFSLTERHGSNMSHYLVTFCGMNGKSDAAIFDLYYDPDEYTSLSIDELIEVINGKIKSIRPLRSNAQPILMPAKNAPLKTKGLEVSGEERMRRIKVIQNNLDFQERVGEALGRRYENVEVPIHAEQLLYPGGFPTEDEARIVAFQLADWEERVKLVDQIKDARVREFARRIVFLERPDLLSDEVRTDMKKWTSMRLLTTEDVPWTTVKKALYEVEECLKNANEEDCAYLMEIKDFINSRVTSA